MSPDYAQEIRNAAWWVRHYARPSQRQQKAQAITRLGLTVRAAFESCEDFEALLFALCHSLSEESQDPRFAVSDAPAARPGR